MVNPSVKQRVAMTEPKAGNAGQNSIRVIPGRSGLYVSGTSRNVIARKKTSINMFNSITTGVKGMSFLHLWRDTTIFQ